TYSSSFEFDPVNMVMGANNQLYVAVTEQAPGSGGEFDTIKQIDGTSGAIVNELTKGPYEGTLFYKNALLRTNKAGTRLYAAETGLAVTGGPGYIDEYDISGAAPVLINRYAFTETFTTDFAVDEQYHRLYILSGGAAVQVVNMTTGSDTFWSIP